MKDRQGAKKLFKTHKGWLAAGVAAATLFSVQAFGDSVRVSADENPATTATTTKSNDNTVTYLQGEIDGAKDAATKAQFQSQLDAYEADQNKAASETPATTTENTTETKDTTPATTEKTPDTTPVAKETTEAAKSTDTAKTTTPTPAPTKTATAAPAATAKAATASTTAPTADELQDSIDFLTTEIAGADTSKPGVADQKAQWEQQLADAKAALAALQTPTTTPTTDPNAVKAKDAWVNIQAGYALGAKGFTPTDLAMKDPAFAAGYAQGLADFNARKAGTAVDPTKDPNWVKTIDAWVEIQAGYALGAKGFQPTALAMKDPAFAAGYAQGIADYNKKHQADPITPDTPNKSTEASDAARAAAEKAAKENETPDPTPEPTPAPTPAPKAGATAIEALAVKKSTTLPTRKAYQAAKRAGTTLPTAGDDTNLAAAAAGAVGILGSLFALGGTRRKRA